MVGEKKEKKSFFLVRSRAEDNSAIKNKKAHRENENLMEMQIMSENFNNDF